MNEEQTTVIICDEIEKKRNPSVFQTGIFMLLVSLSYILISLIISIFSFNPDFMDKYDNSSAFNSIIGSIYEILYLGVPMIMMLIVSKGNVKHTLRLNKLSLSEAGIIVLAGIVLFLANVVLTEANYIACSLFSNIEIPDVPKVKNTADAVVLMIELVIVAPIMEELAMRGFTMRGLEGVSKWFAIIVTGAFFGIMHISYYTLVPKIVIGAVFCYAVYVTDSLEAGIILHAVNNCISGISQICSDLSEEIVEETAEEAVEEAGTLSDSIISIIMMCFLGLCLLFAVFGLISWLKSVMAKKYAKGRITRQPEIRERLDSERKFRLYWLVPIVLSFVPYFLFMVDELIASLK